VPASTDAVSLSAWVQAVLATLKSPANGVFAGDILFVIHGFNEDPASVASLHDEVRDALAKFANYSPTVISFDWPSSGIPFAYLPDLDNAAKSAILVVNTAIKPLLVNQKPDCKVRINALAH
jgi:esterase/lipase superfamily enzyme